MKSNLKVMIDKLFFAYPKKEKLLKNISLELVSGEKVAIMGGNGAGKTTLIGLIKGLYKQDEGLLKISSEKRVLFGDFTALWPELKLSDFIKSYLFLLNENLDYSKIKEEEGKILYFCSLEELKEEKFNKLSFGNQARVILCLYTSFSCPLLILDESFMGVDQAFLKLIKERLLNCLGKEGALILISHRSELIHMFCDVGLVLKKDGSLSPKQSLEQLKKEYLIDCSRT